MSKSLSVNEDLKPNNDVNEEPVAKFFIKIKIPKKTLKEISTFVSESTVPSSDTENIKTLQVPEHAAHRVTPKKKSQKTTQKKKKGLSKADKDTMWNMFDTDKKTQRMTETPEPDLAKEATPNVVKLKETDLCQICDSTLIIMEDGFPTCSNVLCARICKETLDYSPEWRFYGADDKNQNDPTRCGNPINPLLQESSFGCKVLVSNSSTYEMRKIRKWTEWQSMPHKEKSLYDEFQFITIMAQNAGIPKIFIDDAVAIHKDISEQKMFRGMNRDGIKSASIYISCRLNGCPRTAHEIAEIFRLDKASATAGCSMAVKILHNIERNYEPSEQTELCSTRPSAFIERYCSRLNINGELTLLSKFITKKVEQQNIINNNTPHAIAAGIVFFISQNCNLNISKMEIKAICGVSEVTINKCFKKLDNIKQHLIPSCILDKYT
jgi:transcription initiation factor TFIIB